MNLAIIGRSQLFYDAALLLHQNGYRIRAIITSKACPEYTRSEEDFRQLAITMCVPFILTNSLDSSKFNELCDGLDLGISTNWTTVIQDRHINLFRWGILNAHLGHLPRYGGNACSNWAIIRGDSRIAVSIHFMGMANLIAGELLVRSICTSMKIPLSVMYISGRKK